MKRDLDIQDIDLLIAQARKYRSDATGELIAQGSHKVLAWITRALLHVATGVDRFLHVLLMSPTTQR